MSIYTKVGYWMAMAALVLVSTHFVVQTYYELMPMSHWVKYHSIHTTNTTPVAGDHPMFEAKAEVYKVSHLLYHDRLFCQPEATYGMTEGDLNNGFVLRFDREKEDFHREPTDGVESTIFSFDYVPQEDEVCYRTTDIVIFHPFGVKDVQTLSGRNELIFLKGVAR